MTDDTVANKGLAYEQQACHYLQQHGLTLCQRNYRCRFGEIDLIMREASSLVFIEVRYRRSHRFGSGAESVDRRKQMRLIATAAHYLQGQQSSTTQATRFDVISMRPSQQKPQGDIDITWIKDAFQA
jgi:putative endonuclease